MAYDEALAGRVRGLLGVGIEEKVMFGGLCFMRRGHMVCGILGETLMLKLDEEKTATFLVKEPHTRPMDFTGRVSKTMLYVDAPGIKTLPQLRRWVDRAVAFNEGRPAKGATTRRAAGDERRRH